MSKFGKGIIIIIIITITLLLYQLQYYSHCYYKFWQYYAKYAYHAVRVKGGMSLRNGMWHGLRNDIIMRNVKYGNWRKEIN